MEALKGRQGKKKFLQSHTCGSGGGVLGQSHGSAPAGVACVPAMGPWLFMVPAHVERIRARKDMFSPSFLEGGSRGPGDSPEILGMWTAPSPRQTGSVHHLLAALSLLKPPASLEKEPWLGLPSYSWNPSL